MLSIIYVGDVWLLGGICFNCEKLIRWFFYYIEIKQTYFLLFYYFLLTTSDNTYYKYCAFNFLSYF